MNAKAFAKIYVSKENLFRGKIYNRKKFIKRKVKVEPLGFKKKFLEGFFYEKL